MGRSSMGLALAAGMVLAVAGQAPAADEEGGGSIPWKVSWPAAVQAARRSGKPLFIDAGSET
jgi:hypothetical protein